MVGQSESVIKF